MHELVTAVLVAVVIALLVLRTPQVWRERRWARRFGDPDERRVGNELWWGHIARLTAVVGWIALLLPLGDTTLAASLGSASLLVALSR